MAGLTRYLSAACSCRATPGVQVGMVPPDAEVCLTCPGASSSVKVMAVHHQDVGSCV